MLLKMLLKFLYLQVDQHPQPFFEELDDEELDFLQDEELDEELDFLQELEELDEELDFLQEEELDLTKDFWLVKHFSVFEEQLDEELDEELEEQDLDDFLHFEESSEYIFALVSQSPKYFLISSQQ